MNEFGGGRLLVKMEMGFIVQYVYVDQVPERVSSLWTSANIYLSFDCTNCR